MTIVLKNAYKFFMKKPLLTCLTCIIFFASILLAIAGCELFLRYQEGLVSEQKMDPGLLKYHKLYGWELTPNWRGNHYHHDYAAAYSTNSFGFRGTFDFPRPLIENTIAIVGDSFTFGLGVNDNETFPEVLNGTAKGKNNYFNFSIPGFSTDQQYLLIKNRVMNFSPDMLILVTYMGNDFFDNLLAFPLQAENAKPYFEMVGKDLILKNSPVQAIRKTNYQHYLGLKKIGLVPHQKKSWIHLMLQRSSVYRLIEKMFEKKTVLSAARYKPFHSAVDLYSALLSRINLLCIGNQTKLLVVLMPGKSFVEYSNSKEAVFQRFFQKEIIKKTREQAIELLDLATLLKIDYKKNNKHLFFPKEGHLTKQGHKVVANYILKKLDQISKESVIIR